MINVGDENMITVIGSLNVDFNFTTKRFPKIGETMGSEKFDVSYGGKGANQAIAVSRFGENVNFIGAVGDDIFGQEYDKVLAFEKNVTRYIIKKKGTTTGLAMILKTNRDNSIILAHGANYELSVEDIEKYKSVILKSKYLLLQFEIPLETIGYIIDLAYENNIPVVVNPAPYAEFPAEWLEKVTYFTPNEIEYLEYKQSNIYEAKYDEKMIVTLGSKGARFIQDGKKVMVTTPEIEVKDTTGAGDTFNGVFVASLSRGMTLKEACTYAVNAASISTTQLGAQTGMASEAEVSEFMANV